MRPRKITTLHDLEAFLAQARHNGLGPSDHILMMDIGEGGLVAPTFILSTDAPYFVAIEYWADEVLADNSRHNDQLGTEADWEWLSHGEHR